MQKTLTARTLMAADRPAFYFIGVTTGRSSIRRVFPAWVDVLGLGDVEMVGIDLPLHAPRDDYRAVVDLLAHDPLSLGALVTTHKIDLYQAAHDLMDEVDPLASLMGEVSCLSKRGGLLLGSAKDPYSAGLALDAFLPSGHFTDSNAEVFIMGAGGSAIAIDWYLSRPERGEDRPSLITVSDRSQPRLDALRAIHNQACETELAVKLAARPTDNDRITAGLPMGSVIINATGLGKDAPGSPLTDDVSFPRSAYLWDLNYRGNLVFLDQARAEADKDLHIIDGWDYFLHGWTQVIGEVFEVAIPTSGPTWNQLAQIAGSTR